MDRPNRAEDIFIKRRQRAFVDQQLTVIGAGHNRPNGAFFSFIEIANGIPIK
jgi:hypothetical protein